MTSKIELISKAAAAIDGHDFDVLLPEHRVACDGCDWVAGGLVFTDTGSHARHLAELALDAVSDELRAEGATKALALAADLLDLPGGAPGMTTPRELSAYRTAEYDARAWLRAEAAKGVQA